MDKEAQYSFFKKEFMIVALATLCIFLLWVRNGIFYSSFNLDEVILFFTSRGFFPGEAPIDPTQIETIDKMILVNRNGGSLDPGLFTYILRVWGTISMKTFWLRSLPLGFFTLGLIFIYRLSLNLSAKVTYATLLPLLFFSNTTLLDYAFTLRPYSMEFCGLCFLILTITENYKLNEPGPFKNLFLGTTLAFFLGSRYGLFIPVFIYYGLELVFIKSLNKKSFFLQLCPIVISGLVFYLLSYRYQVEFLPLLYAQEYFLHKLTGAQLLKQFFGIKSTLLYFSLLYYFLFKTKEWTIKSTQGGLFAVTTLFLITGILLDLLNVSPLFFYRRYSLALQSCLIFLSLVVFLDLLKQFNKLSNEKIRPYIFLTTFLLGIFSLRTFNYRFKQRSDLVPIVRLLESDSAPNQQVLCDKVTFDMLKFLQFYNRYNIDWEKMPKVSPLKFDRNGKVDEAQYYMTIYGAENIYKPDDVIKKQENLKLIYGGSYQRLYKRSLL